MKVGIDVVTGFLGAGKSAFINSLINKTIADKEKIVVVTCESGKTQINEFNEKDAVVIGISKDSVKSHKNFSTKQGLTFTLLSDPELIAIQAYDVWQEKKMYGKVSMGVVRSSYLIDENGIIEKVYEKVKPDMNATEMLKDME